MIARRITLFVLLLTLVAAATAQRPLNPPNYYAFQLPVLVPGVPMTGELTAEDGQNFKDGAYVDMFVFDGKADDFVSLRVTSGEFDAHVTVFDPSGYLLDLNDDYSGSGDTSAGVDLWLPETGRYFVVVSGFSQFDIGYYAVELSAGATLPTFGDELMPLTFPTVIDSELTADMPMLAGGYVGNTEYFRFEVEAPSFFVINMWSWDFDTVLTIFDEYGDIVVQNDDFDYSSDSRITIELWPGSYVLAASSYYTGNVGYYTIDARRYVEAD